MAGETQMPPERRSWRKILIAITVIAIIVVIGFAFDTYNIFYPCGSSGCPSTGTPVIDGAFVTQASGMTYCGITTQGTMGVVCPLTLSGGDTGTVVMNLTSLQVDSYVAFGTYASSQHVKYANFPPFCLYSTAQPDYNTLRCPVSSSGTTYRFNFSVDETAPASQQVVLTIVMTMTCCFP